MTDSENIKKELRHLLPRLIELRRKLHRQAELAGFEKETSGLLAKFISRYHPAQIIRQVGGHGLLAVFEGPSQGPTVVLRAEMDALPIPEENDFAHSSINRGVSHKCGHDGHMTILAGLAVLLSKHPPEKGKIVLLFQPAEETGQGAQKVMNDPRFLQIKPDYILALHNFPGFPLKQIILKKKTIFCASRGLIITLKGKTAHAAYPDEGISPAWALSELIQKLSHLPASPESKNTFAALTIIHARLGEIAFGTAPAEAVLMCTLRSETDKDMDLLMAKSKSIVENIARSHQLQYSINFSDIFQATENDSELVDLIEETAEGLGFEYQYIQNTFRPSEDFGVFSHKFRGALFGIGAGENHPGLHQSHYDFPEELLESGILIFWQLLHKFL